MNILQYQKNTLGKAISQILSYDIGNKIKDELVNSLENKNESYVYIFFQSIINSSEDKYLR